MHALVITSGKLKGKVLKVPEHEVTIGRGEECDLRIPSSEISRVHCKLWSNERGIVVKDLDSKNGTYVNGMVIYRVTLMNPGDKLRVGPLECEVAGKSEPESKKVPARDNSTLVKKKTTASDDDIADWLSEDEGALDGDTAIISARDIDSAKSGKTPEASSVRSQSKEPGAASTEATDRKSPLVERMDEIVKDHWRRSGE